MGAPTWELRLGDCLDPVTGMASLADKSVDHVITDPPYSSHVDKNSMRGTGHKPGGRRQDLGFNPVSPLDIDSACHGAARIARRWSVVFCDVESVHMWRAAFQLAELEAVRVGAWVKENATPQFTGDRPAAGFEAIVVAHRPGRKRWNGGGKLGVWTCATAYRDGDDVVHTTQKPVALMGALIRDFTDPGDLICDPFAGSGTTGVAALRLGRRFIGWERDPKYHAIAVKRLTAAREQRDLFEAEAPPVRKAVQGKLL